MHSRKSTLRQLALAVLLVPLVGATVLSGQTGAAPDLFKTITYRPVGPSAQGGRFVAFAVPLQQPGTFYAAAGSGGLWKTVNHGETFEPIFDFEKTYSIGAVAVAPSDPNVLYLGTGEANSSRSTYWGDGIYKSIDAGKTWKNVGLPESHHIARIVVHPTDPDVVYVAALGHLYSENPERGLFKTVNGGKTWTKVLFVDNRTGASDVVLDPKNPATVYAATYDKLRLPWTYMIGGPGSGIHKSTNGGRTWTKLAGGLPTGMLGRIGLAVYPKKPSVLYAVIENVNKPGVAPEARWKEILEGKSSTGIVDGELYRTDDAGAAWRKVSPEKQSIGSGPGYYYADVIVDPNDDKHVMALSVSVQESKDGGKTWGPTWRFGGDNHALWIDPADSKHMILGYDHGLGVTFDGGKAWHRPDHMPVAQFYAVDYDMSFPYRIAGGLQDNGSLIGPSSNKNGAAIDYEDWTTVGGGDGMYNAFDRKTNRYLYNESQFGPLSRLDLQTGETKGIAYRGGAMKRFNWCAPIHVSYFDPNVVYHCGNIVVKSMNRGETWTEISPDLTTNDKVKMPNGTGGDGNIQYCTITTFAESTLQSGLLWVGTDDGLVWVTRDDGKNWTKVSDKIAGNPGYWVSRVEASASDPGTAYVAYTGLRNDDFKPFLYKTTDFGQTWSSIAANLPNEPVNVIREDPKNPLLLFAGTDFAVWTSLDGGKSWARMKANMPTVAIQDLKIHPRENDLIVATHGRSAWIADISALEEMTPQAVAADAYLCAVEPRIRWNRELRRESAGTNLAGVSEPAGIAINYYLKAKPAGEVKVQILKGATVVSEIKGSADAGLNAVIWNMSRDLSDAEKQAASSQRSRFGRGAGGPAAPEGEYTVALLVDGRKITGKAVILPDPTGVK
ncbi:MAG: hypothetical protein NTZ26_06970 [Candidatus Aminicenantes bacterium]|nr:hypothetical protein [Candidatus Aminicenantes bacterium]